MSFVENCQRITKACQVGYKQIYAEDTNHTFLAMTHARKQNQIQVLMINFLQFYAPLFKGLRQSICQNFKQGEGGGGEFVPTELKCIAKGIIKLNVYNLLNVIAYLQ